MPSASPWTKAFLSSLFFFFFLCHGQLTVVPQLWGAWICSLCLPYQLAPSQPAAGTRGCTGPCACLAHLRASHPLPICLLLHILPPVHHLVRSVMSAILKTPAPAGNPTQCSLPTQAPVCILQSQKVFAAACLVYVSCSFPCSHLVGDLCLFCSQEEPSLLIIVLRASLKLCK